MKHLILFSLFIFGIVCITTAKEVKPETAKLAAHNLFQQVNKVKSSINFELVYTSKSNLISNLNKSDSNDIPLFYVFNADNNNGFVIVAGDDNAMPILGYSTNGSFDNSNLPSNFKKWIEGYKNQLRYIITNNVQATDEIKNKWDRLNSGQSLTGNKKSTSAVNPLVTTTWGQSPYVNDLCPYDIEAGEANGYHCVSGCPATTMAQIMKYWNYPANGTGFHSYNHTNYGTLSANFASTTYDWGAMPNNVSSTNNAVATLMSHCGVAVEMQYGPTSSGSYVIIDGYPMEQTSEYAYKTYFGYDPSTLQGLRRENYSDIDWKQLLKNDLDLGRPIQYAGFGAGGHTFVCDGYDDNDYFHMNWGWGGYADGYFLIDALNPGSGGTGSGAGTYNNGQQAVLGIQPPNGGGSATFDISLYDNVVATPNPLFYGQEF
ncbi:MAG: C10 family peptidase, partial [Calditrichaeota bacterium]|nr:C10 family peptidase [Calditrichota bacterium]